MVLKGGISSLKFVLLPPSIPRYDWRIKPRSVNVHNAESAEINVSL